MELRPTTDGDLPAMLSIFDEAIGSVFRPHGFDPPSYVPGAFTNIQGHIRRTGLSVLAEEDGAVIGWGSSWTRGDDWFLASLFVAPSAHGRGVGPVLLDAVWGEARRRRTITDAIQPISNALYGRRGLAPVTPLLTFAGTPRLETAATEPREADLAAIDEVAYGFDRDVDHRYWSQHARRTEWGDAYSYAFPGGDIGPVGGRTPEAAAAALAGELARAEGDVRLRVPGSARRLVEVALAAGLRLGQVPGLLLLSPGAEAPTALAVSGYALL